jgi:SH3-like domain-containing protein
MSGFEKGRFRRGLLDRTSIREAPIGQANGKRRRGPALAAPLVAAGLALAGCGPGGRAEDCPDGSRLSRPSGYCVPRYLSLKRGEVFARRGPGKDYPAMWVYRAQGLPVQVVAETMDWRRVCDPDGGAAWVHRSMVDGKRTVLALGERPVPLRREPKPHAPAAGLLKARSLAGFDRCEGGWCKVSAGGVSGWVAQGEIWGTAPAAQCR